MISFSRKVWVDTEKLVAILISLLCCKIVSVEPSDIGRIKYRGAYFVGRLASFGSDGRDDAPNGSNVGAGKHAEAG